MGLATIMKTWVDPGGDRRVVAARGPLWVTVGSVITLVRLLTYVELYSLPEEQSGTHEHQRGEPMLLPLSRL
ncbi:hypothetical protein ROHU_026711 [Labeo rohita]|uniref:Uncharacterized protein n=1 Tax=Labeo rohita TaxID=84645 RepID=A0A498MCV9_LABRO|nr:hypothetical protein ROHU_026711 [Labeo rohita]